MMEAMLREWDGETVIARFDSPSGAWIFIAAHSTRLGPATGGTRMKVYSNQEAALRDALRLSSAMTYKFAVPGIALGGGKAVISAPTGLETEPRLDLLRRYGGLIHQLGGYFYTGPDVGTSSMDMDVIAETGAPYVFCRTPEAGGSGSSGPVTALGVFTGIRVACEHAFGDPSLKGRKALVQGVGSVGRPLIEHLMEAGAEILFSEVDEDLAGRVQEELDLTLVSPEKVYATDCDIFSPCALGGVLNANTIAQLTCKVIAGGANNQLETSEAARMLAERGILYAPDYVVNVGGAMAIPGIEIQGWSHQEANRRVAESVRYALTRIFEIAKAERITTDEAARRIAEEHLSAAGSG